ncbi:MAG: phosphoglucosamine mutase [Clostridiales bacterium]|nr:phosphoglucosamine mutase [Clostridiales bacterium]
MGSLFGNGDVRGIANTELTPDLAFKLGKATGYVLGKTKDKPVFLIGKDTRLSGDMLEDALSAGFMSTGANVIKVGVLPTPAIAYLVKAYGADAGVIVSASHNSFEYNGIKFYNSEGFKMDDSFEDEVETIMLRNIHMDAHVSGERIGRCLDADDEAEDKYAAYLESTIDTDISGLKLVVDCANGSAYKVAEKVFKDLGADVTLIGNQPDGLNINAKCGSTHPDLIQKEVVARGAFMGFAYDGDADRLIACDEKGNLIDGDKLMCICARMLKEREELPENKVVSTVMSNIGFHKFMKQEGINIEITDVGDRYVLDKMLEEGAVFGGEQSGHIIFLNHATTGDGILSSLQLLQAVLSSGKTASEASEEIAIYPQVLKNARVKIENKSKYAKDADINEAVRELCEELGEDGRVLIRPSSTEPLVRVMIEGQDIQDITAKAQKLARLITKHFS